MSITSSVPMRYKLYNEYWVRHEVGEMIKDKCKLRKLDFIPEAVGNYIFINNALT